MFEKLKQYKQMKSADQSQDLRNVLFGFDAETPDKQKSHYPGVIEKINELFQAINGMNAAVLALARAANITPEALEAEMNNQQANTEYLNKIKDLGMARAQKQEADAAALKAETDALEQTPVDPTAPVAEPEAPAADPVTVVEAHSELEPTVEPIEETQQ